MVICLERGADLHMAQLMPLPLTVSCFTKIQTGFTFLVPAHLVSPGKRAVKRVCVCVSFIVCVNTQSFSMLMLFFICCSYFLCIFVAGMQLKSYCCVQQLKCHRFAQKNVSDVSVRYSSNSLRKDVIRFPTEFQDERILKYKICDRVTV